ncbi:MAG: hypothetical protein IT373_20575 [Polyangiaceae bacterium]|nr:hypothetical protein [Polyangiaceae bacterium]
MRVVGAAVVVALHAAIGFVPLFDGPGYEYALASGLVLPLVCAVVVALDLSARARDPFHAYCRAVGTGAGYALLGWLVALAHGLRAGLCDPWGGTLLYALGPGVGAVLAAVWGAVAAELALRLRRRRLIAVLSGLALPVGHVAFGLAWFYFTPTIFAYSPFVGLFSGSLYETVIDSSGLGSYRVASAATLFSGYVLALHLVRRDGARLGWRSVGRPGLLALGMACAAASFASVLFGSALGHWQTASTIAAELGGRIEGESCDVVHASTLGRDDVRRFARECEASVREVAAGLGIEPRRIRVFLFADAAQKRRLMGAGDVLIAKPWRDEIYLNPGGYPHRVLSHELVHALAAPLGRGPFAIAGALGGLWPSPGLIEGLAVAFSPPEGQLSASEWAKAMRAIGILPSLERLFALGFLGEHADTAYTAAGAFVGWVRDRYGLSVVQRWYGGADLAELTGAALAELERAWHEALDALALEPEALAQARARFDQPGVFGRTCPHAVDALLGEAGRASGAGDCGRAVARYDAVLGLDRGNARALFERASCRDGIGQGDAARAELAALAADPSVHVRQRERATERLGDLFLRDGAPAEARRRYAELRSDGLGEDRLRTLDVKEAVADDPLGRDAVVALLVGRAGRAPDLDEAIDLLGRWRARSPEDGLPEYLIGRQHHNAGRFALAAERLDAALGLGLALPRVRVEALRLRLEAACALEDEPGVRTTYAAYVAEPGVTPNRKRAAHALVARCLPEGSERPPEP